MTVTSTMPNSIETRVAVLENEMNNIKETCHEIKENQTAFIVKQEAMHAENKKGVSDVEKRMSEIERKIWMGVGVLAAVPFLLKIPDFITWLSGKH